MSPLTTTVGFSTEATLSKHNTLSITRCNHVEGQPKNELSVRFDGECEQGSPVCCVETHECVRIVVRCARREWGVPKESGSGEESAKGILQIHTMGKESLGWCSTEGSRCRLRRTSELTARENLRRLADLHSRSRCEQTLCIRERQSMIRRKSRLRKIH